MHQGNSSIEYSVPLFLSLVLSMGSSDRFQRPSRRSTDSGGPVSRPRPSFENADAQHYTSPHATSG